MKFDRWLYEEIFANSLGLSKEAFCLRLYMLQKCLNREDDIYHWKISDILQYACEITDWKTTTKALRELDDKGYISKEGFEMRYENFEA